MEYVGLVEYAQGLTCGHLRQLDEVTVMVGPTDGGTVSSKT